MSNITYFNEENQLKLKFSLYKFCKDYEKNKLRIIDNLGNVYTSNFLFFYNFIINESFKDKSWKNMLVEYFSKCEKLYPGSSFLLAKLISGYYTFNKKEVEYSKNYKDFEKYVLSNSKHGSEFLDIIKFSGPDASIKLETTKSDKISIYKRSTSRFDLSNNNSTASMFFKNNKKIKRSVRSVVIDGYIEKENEIFILLENCFLEKNIPLIVCRGISENLLRFINSFIIKNKFPVLVYDNKFNNDDPFLFKDFAKLNGSSPVSIDTGDNIRLDCFEKSFVIDNCILSRDIIEFKPSKENMGNLIFEINQQRKLSNNEDFVKYFDLRKKRCGINVVEVYIPYLQKSKIQEFKFLIQCYNSIAKFGMTKISGVLHGKQEVDVVKKLYEKFNIMLDNTSMFLDLNKE